MMDTDEAPQGEQGEQGEQQGAKEAQMREKKVRGHGAAFRP